MIYNKDNIYIGAGLLNNLQLITSKLPSNKLLIVTDEIVGHLHLKRVRSALAAYDPDILILPSGETNKNWFAVESILQALLQHKHDRHSTIISLGGGVVGDLTGFAASIYMRGINWIQIPTTLLAQVDAAIGGKTGCNFAGVKNLIGTFYFPQAILIDTEFLTDLPDKDYLAGLAEVVKYGMACDAAFFCWLEEHKQQILKRDAEILKAMIIRSCELKLAVVQDDVHDLDQRMILNFGHSFAHAIEAASGFKHYLHGEAVAIGMLIAARWAVKLGILKRDILDRLCSLIVYFGLPTELDRSICSLGMLFDCITNDKKKRAGILNFILPCALGRVVKVERLETQDLEDVLQEYA